jgi:hypothetical protein
MLCQIHVFWGVALCRWDYIPSRNILLFPLPDPENEGKTIKLKSMVDHNRYETSWKRRYTAPSGVGEHYCSQHSSLPLSKARPWWWHRKLSITTTRQQPVIPTPAPPPPSAKEIMKQALKKSQISKLLQTNWFALYHISVHNIVQT